MRGGWQGAGSWPCRRRSPVHRRPRTGTRRATEAEVAVLRAAAGLHRHDPLDLHLGAAPPHPHLVGQRQQLAEALVRQLKAAQDLLLVQPAARLEDLAARLAQNVVGRTSPGSAQTNSAAHARSFAAHARSFAAHARSFCHALVSRNASGSKQPPNVAARPALAALRNAARSSVPAPSLSTPCTRPRVRPSRSVLLLRSAIPGFSGHDPRISPSSVIPREASASRVSAVWFSVPSPAAATTSTGAPSASARSAMVPPAGPYRTSSPPAPSTSTCCLIAARPRTVSAAAARSSGGRPAARAAASGESGPGNLASSWVSVIPASRDTSARSPGAPGGRPVCAGLTTATLSPRARASAARAAVTTVLPTPVPVPLMMTTLMPLPPGPGLIPRLIPVLVSPVLVSPVLVSPVLVRSVQPGHQLVPVPAVPGLGPLHRGSGDIERLPGQEQQGDR